MRLIDAYALQDQIHKSKMQNPHKDAKTATNHEIEHDHFMQMVVLQPTVQEEIIRCKDCKYGVKCLPDASNYSCTKAFGEKTPHPYDWFCADGKGRMKCDE